MTLQIKKYVLGFAFWRDQVALIYKTKGPEYVIGTWNGIGGKIEDTDLSIYHAMSREFLEETGVPIIPGLWQHFATQSGLSWDAVGYELNCFRIFLNPDQEFFYHIVNTEGDGEEVAWWDYRDVNFDKFCTPNLQWIIPLALDKTTGFLEINER
jgi:8-oxo-dGTP pyrophosphatase MutT (NUDIX family)